MPDPRVPTARVRPVTKVDLDLVVLGGGGHVGLPLSLAFADSGWRVGIYDIDAGKLARIAAGSMPFRENGADALLPKMLAAGRLAFDSDASMLERTDRILVVVGTPVDEFLGPSMTIFERTVAEIAPHLRDGALVVLRSTVYPGTTEFVAQKLSERGRRVDVAFCPERIAEGQALEELGTLHRSSAPTKMERPSALPTCSRDSVPGPSGRPRRRPSSRSCSRIRGDT